MQNNRNQLPNRWDATRNDKSRTTGSVEKNKRLIIYIVGALVVFIILHRVWFYVMGAFAVIGVVWVTREYNRKEDDK